MAKIKIKEGSCEIWHVGKPQKKLDDETHKPNSDTVQIHFTKTRQKYTFKKGVLVKMT